MPDEETKKTTPQEQALRWIPVLVIFAGVLISYATLDARVAEQGRRCDRIEEQARTNGASLDGRLSQISSDLRNLSDRFGELRTTLETERRMRAETEQRERLRLR